MFDWNRPDREVVPVPPDPPSPPPELLKHFPKDAQLWVYFVSLELRHEYHNAAVTALSCKNACDLADRLLEEYAKRFEPSTINRTHDE